MFTAYFEASIEELLRRRIHVGFEERLGVNPVPSGPSTYCRVLMCGDLSREGHIVEIAEEAEWESGGILWTDSGHSLRETLQIRSENQRSVCSLDTQELWCAFRYSWEPHFFHAGS